MNIERAVVDSAGGRGGWVHDVCLVAVTYATRSSGRVPPPPNLLPAAQVGPPEQGEDDHQPQHTVWGVTVPCSLLAEPLPQEERIVALNCEDQCTTRC